VRVIAELIKVEATKTLSQDRQVKLTFITPQVEALRLGMLPPDTALALNIDLSEGESQEL